MCFSYKRHSGFLETNLCSCLLEKELVTFAPSERWRLVTSPYSFKTVSLGVPEDDVDFSGDGGPLLTYMKQTSLAASFFLFPSSPGSSLKISMISERLESVAVVNHATFLIQLKVMWNQSPSYNSLNPVTVLVGFNQKDCRTFSTMYLISKLPECWFLSVQFAVSGCLALPGCHSVRVLQGLCKTRTGLQPSKQILTLAGTWWYTLPIPSLFFSSAGGWWWRCWSPQVCTYC